MPQKRFDIVIIGSGPGGYRAAVSAALRGQQVAIIEKHLWGGCCLNRGCVPKKDWYYSAKLLQQPGLSKRGIQGDLRPDLGQAWRHQHEIVSRVRDSYINYMQRLGITRLEGHGRLLDANTIEITSVDTKQTIEGNYIILGTGSSPYVPTNLSLAENRVITTDSLFEHGLPQGERVGIVGSGVIASEFAYIFKHMGLDLHWFCRSQPLQRSGFSQPALKALTQAFEQQDIRHVRYTNLALLDNDKQLLIDIDQQQVELDWLLLATGRQPHTSELGLENTAIKTNSDGFIETNLFKQTAEENIYAIGDCASPQMTANQALADASIVIDNILLGNTKHSQPEWVPQSIYSAVEMARIGLNEDMAEDAGFEPAVGFASFESSPLALGRDQHEGFVRILADMDSGEYLGAEVIGDEAAELIHQLTESEDRKAFLRRLIRRPVNHPSRSEELLNATETMASKWGLGEFLFDD